LISLSNSGRKLAGCASLSIHQSLQTVWTLLDGQDIDLIIESTRVTIGQLGFDEVDPVETTVQPFYVTSIVVIVNLYTALVKQLAGLSMTEFRILFELFSAKESLGGTNLAKRLFISPSVVSVAIQKMADRGLVAQESNERDRRSLDYSLTEAGEKASTVALRALEERTAELYGGLTPEQFSHLVVTADKIVEYLHVITF
jgi:DNA-binding MarR family transcriptional regulator